MEVKAFQSCMPCLRKWLPLWSYLELDFEAIRMWSLCIEPAAIRLVSWGWWHDAHLSWDFYCCVVIPWPKAVWRGEVLWVRMVPTGSYVWVLGPSSVELLGRISKWGIAGEGMSLGAGFEMSKASPFPLSCLCFLFVDRSRPPFQHHAYPCCHALSAIIILKSSPRTL